MSNAPEAIDVLTRLKAMDVTISIDDFGTGFSSLSYLKRLPIDTLKIDQSFVRDITTDPDDAAIATAVIALAHTLKLRVEHTDEVRKILSALAEAGTSALGLDVRKPNLEAVFLKLTGEELREGAPAGAPQ